MTAYTSIPNTDLDADSPVTTALVTALRDNPTAITEGSVGAPQNQTASLADLVVTTAKINAGAITQAKIAAAAVGQSQLKASTASQTVSVPIAGNAELVLTGGAYSFWFAGASTSDTYIRLAAHSSTYAARVGFANLDSGLARTAYLYSVYVTASPPYDLGDGDVPLFVFALIDNVTGEILGTSAAPDAPWHHNGPTDCRADYYDANGRGWRQTRTRETMWETDPTTGLMTPRTILGDPTSMEITQAIKQADMPLIPHPFIGNDLTGKTVVLLDPVSELMGHLAEMQTQGENISDLLHHDYLRIDNTTLNRAGPPGVIVVPARWRNTQ